MRFNQVSSSPPAGSRVTQEIWYVDPASGNDRNDGASSGTAIKTFAELARRWGPDPVFECASPLTSFAYEIYVLSNMVRTDPLRIIGNGRLGAETALAIIGARTTVSSRTFTAASNATRSTNTAATLTDSGVATWTVGTRIRTASGDKVTYVMKDNGAHVARVMAPAIPTFGSHANQVNWFVPSVTASTIGTVAYVTETLTQIYLGDFKLWDEKSFSPNYGVFSELVFQDCDFVSDAGMSVQLPIGNCIKNFVACRFSSLCELTQFHSACYFNSCYFHQGLLVIGGVAVVNSCLAAKQNGAAYGGFVAYGTAASLLIDLDSASQGSPIIGMNGANLQIGTACVFDAATNALAAEGTGLVIGGAGYSGSSSAGALLKTFAGGTHALWGSGNAAYGVRVGAGGNLVCQTVAALTITGTSGDFKLGSATSGPATSALGVLSVGAIAYTWALLNTSFVGAGLGGRVIDPNYGAGILAA